MDVGRSFAYVLEDEEWWKKILIGGLLSLIPIVGQFYVLGYVLEAIKNVIDGREVPLPEVLENFGGRIVKGLLLSVIALVYALPIIILVGCPGAALGIFTEQLAESEAAGIIIAVVSVCFGGLGVILGILLGLIMPFAWAKYADTGQMGAAFQIGEIFGMLRNNIGPAFIVLLVSALASFAASLVGSLLCGIGLPFAMLYGQLVMAFLYGSIYRTARDSVL